MSTPEREVAELASDTIGYECRHVGIPDESVPGLCPECWELGQKVADAVLAAGYRKPRTIITAEELDALADGSAVLDADSDISTKHGGRWHGYEMAPLDSRKFSKCGPFTVLHEPEADQ